MVKSTPGLTPGGTPGGVTPIRRRSEDELDSTRSHKKPRTRVRQVVIKNLSLSLSTEGEHAATHAANAIVVNRRYHSSYLVNTILTTINSATGKYHAHMSVHALLILYREVEVSIPTSQCIARKVPELCKSYTPGKTDQDIHIRLARLEQIVEMALPHYWSQEHATPMSDASGPHDRRRSVSPTDDGYRSQPEDEDPSGGMFESGRWYGKSASGLVAAPAVLEQVSHYDPKLKPPFTPSSFLDYSYNIWCPVLLRTAVLGTHRIWAPNRMAISSIWSRNLRLRPWNRPLLNVCSG